MATRAATPARYSRDVLPLLVAALPVTTADIERELRTAVATRDA